MERCRRYLTSAASSAAAPKPSSNSRPKALPARADASSPRRSGSPWRSSSLPRRRRSARRRGARVRPFWTGMAKVVLACVAFSLVESVTLDTICQRLLGWRRPLPRCDRRMRGCTGKGRQSAPLRYQSPPAPAPARGCHWFGDAAPSSWSAALYGGRRRRGSAGAGGALWQLRRGLGQRRRGTGFVW